MLGSGESWINLASFVFCDICNNFPSIPMNIWLKKKFLMSAFSGKLSWVKLRECCYWSLLFIEHQLCWMLSIHFLLSFQWPREVFIITSIPFLGSRSQRRSRMPLGSKEEILKINIKSRRKELKPHGEPGLPTWRPFLNYSLLSPCSSLCCVSREASLL